jgi:multidrug efflux pump subunit AcrA (membrane-fusion protein)
VRVRLDDADPHVRMGMTAEATAVVESRQNVLVIPNQYIRLDRVLDKAYVSVPEPDGTLREIEVTLGLQGQDTSEIVAGLREGNVIAVRLGGDAIPGLGG